MAEFRSSGLGESASYAHSVCVFSVLVSLSPVESDGLNFEKMETLILFGFLAADFSGFRRSGRSYAQRSISSAGKRPMHRHFQLIQLLKALLHVCAPL